jgi:hypothetical protein
VTAAYHCRVCREVVETYTPTGTRVLRAADHAHPSSGSPCSGRFGPVDPAHAVERDRAASARWRSGRSS